MIYYTSWLSNDAQLKALQAQRNEANAARYYESLGPVRFAAHHFASLLRRGWQRWRSHAQMRAAASELSSLDDRLLKDIGVSREQIPGLALKAANATLFQVAETPPANPARPETAAEAVTRPECQVIPLTPAARKPDIQFNERGRKHRYHLPLNAA